MLYDHADLRVSSLAKARGLYDALLRALGYTRITGDATCVYYHLPGRDTDFFGLNEDRSHWPGGTRIAFAASNRAQVDSLAELARTTGARAFEPPHLCTEYAEDYYAAFFEDASGNKLEVCFRDNRCC